MITFMSTRLILTLSLSAGLVGGVVSHYISPQLVQAQGQPAVPREIRAQSFVLIDAQGAAVALFGFDPKGQPIIKLLDERGRTVWSTIPSVRPPSGP
jgi:hypothetical protein